MFSCFRYEFYRSSRRSRFTWSTVAYWSGSVNFTGWLSCLFFSFSYHSECFFFFPLFFLSLRFACLPWPSFHSSVSVSVSLEWNQLWLQAMKKRRHFALSLHCSRSFCNVYPNQEHGEISVYLYNWQRIRAKLVSDLTDPLGSAVFHHFHQKKKKKTLALYSVASSQAPPPPTPTPTHPSV